MADLPDDDRFVEYDEAAAWQEIARHFCNDQQYYKGLLLLCAKHLGDEVFICDDGSRSLDPLISKVPELVAKLAAGVGYNGLPDDDE